MSNVYREAPIVPAAAPAPDELDSLMAEARRRMKAATLEQRTDPTLPVVRAARRRDFGEAVA